MEIVPGPVPPDAGAISVEDAGDAPRPIVATLLRRGGELTLADARGEDAGASVCVMRDPAAPEKLGAAHAALDRLAKATASSPASLFLQIDEARAPRGEDARRAALAAVGVRGETFAGKIVTVRLEAAAVCDLVDLPWVVALEAPGFARPR